MSYGIAWRRFGRFIGVFAGIAALTVLTVAFARDKINSARQAELVEQLKTGMVFDLEGLAGRLAEAQAELMPILPPEPTLRIHQSGGMLTFDPTGFPKDFLAGLVYEIEHGCPVYTVTVQENSLTGEILYYNGDDKLVASLPPVKDYDIWWLFERFHPALYTRQAAVDEKTAWFMTLFDPLRLEFEFQLLPADYIETYAANAVASWPMTLESLSMAKGGGMQNKMMRQDRASTSIVVVAISRLSTNVQLTVQYPNDFTNRLEIFTCGSLYDPWSLIVTNLSTLGTNEIQWTDTTAGGVSNRFYAVHDADTDSDSDGLVDGREQRMYRTCATNNDTDGDGLVDGFSGLVGTNSYPGGATTNNGIFVEGEMTWTTAPAVFDTDDDGMGDGWEVAHGHNPVDANDPPNVSGTIFYAGRQTGTVHVIAVTTSGSWSTNASCTLAMPAIYLIPHLEQTNYWLKAWMDTVVDGFTNATEACGVYTNASIVITNRVTGKDIVLIDPDNDSDGVPDWWEMVYFGSVTNLATDPDGDHYNNQEEYEAGTDPTNSLSHPWNLGGTITYTGPQTGTVWVAACSDGTTWNWARVATNGLPGAYTITHLPPNTNYWVRAWRDSNGDGQPPSPAEGYAAWEAWGTHSGNPVMLDTNVAGVDVTLTDPDNDADGLSDWWEVRYGLDSTAGGAGSAVAWWKLDETTGTNAADSIGTNHGIIYGLATTGWVAGVVGNGLVFDGSNTYVEVPDSGVLKPVKIGIGFWIKPGMTYTNGKSATFLSKEDPAADTGFCMSYTNGALLFRFRYSGAREIKWPCALTAGVPVHVAGTYNGAWQRLYVNAQIKAETNYIWGTSFGDIAQGTNNLRLGTASTGTASNFFKGLLDDVRITGDDWTSNQIHAVWELGADPDKDGLGYAEEYRAGTDPGGADTDGDGLSDGDEVLKWGCNPLLLSSDGSGMTDGEKVALGLNPNLADTDQDGASDVDELTVYFTDPLDPDSDNDGLADGAEIQNHTYPGHGDTDDDGLTDKQEVDLGTNPLLADTDGDGIDDAYEHNTTGWDPLDSSNAGEDDDQDGFSNLQEYQWCYSPKYSNTHDYVQRLIVVPPGINSKRTIADSSHYRMLAAGDWSHRAKIWVRPLGYGTNTLPQRLHHSQTPGFYINGVEAPGVPSPIDIPAVNITTEFIITSSSAAWGTNILFRLTKTNDTEGTYCRTFVYSPKLTQVSFSTRTSGANYTNVAFGATGTLYYCWSGTNDHSPPVFLDPGQSPSQGYGIPYFNWTDWCRFEVTGNAGYHFQDNTLNIHDYKSACGSSVRYTTGITFDPGTFRINVGFDMNGDGVLQEDERQQSCDLVAIKVDLDVDSDNDNDIDTDDDGIEMTAGGRLFVNQDDDNGNALEDKNETNAVAGENDLKEIHLKLYPSDFSSGTLKLEAAYGGSLIKVWESPDKGTEIKLPKIWTNGVDTVPEVLYVEGTTASMSERDVWLRLQWKSGTVTCDDDIKLTVIGCDLVPDWNHDRIINNNDKTGMSTNTFHFWINDDADVGDVAGEDSGDSYDCPVHWEDWVHPIANCERSRVWGRRDLVDFFPVWLDLNLALNLLPTSSGYQYKLKQAGSAVKAVYTDLTKSHAGDYLTTEGSIYGSTFDQPAYTASVFAVTSAGVTLSTDFLDKIKSNATKGVLLMEGATQSGEASASPLVLEIWKDGAKVCEKRMPLSLSGVEQMYRYLNLRNVCGDSSGGASHTGEPSNYPDSLCGDKHVVFIHGFNESADDGRGNIAETFKRLYWSDSKAKYTGVAWRGDMGATHYHASVTNAFATAPAFAQYIGTLQGEVNVIAFSLGNMVVSSAIQDGGAGVDRYFMLHAAMAREAYDTGQEDADMRHVYWRDYTNTLYASKWHDLFPSGDGRNELTWKGRFPSVVGSQVYNFYSSGEDVLQNLTDGGIGFGALWDIIWGRYQYVWCIQELWKGRYWDFVGGSTYGGWGFTDNHAYYTATTDEYNNVTWTLWDASTANQQVTNMDLKAVPFFNSSAPVPSVVQEPNNPSGAGSQFATANRAQLLAEMVPALSFAAGANPVQRIADLGGMNINMQGQLVNGGYQNGWPAGRLSGWSGDRWLHGDYRTVAYIYVYKLFDDIVKTKGHLDQ